MIRIREILVVAHAHHDVGYTHSPRTVLDIHRRSVREAIRLASLPHSPGDEPFRWTFEVARPVYEFLREARPEEAADLVRLVAAERLSVTGGYLNSTQLVGSRELIRSYAGTDRLRRIGIPVRVVQHADINGLPWGTVQAMTQAGLDVLVMALNPNHGRPPFEQPTAFWWEGPDGSRVLAWLSLHYGLAETWGLLDDDMAGVAGPLAETVARLEERDDYPFDFMVLHATDDNGWPTRHAADGVRAWNQAHPDRPMSTATIDQAMDRARTQAATASLPVWRGEWADWWAHGHGSSADEVAVSRSAGSLIHAAESALAIARLESGAKPAGERRAAWRRDPLRVRTEAETVEAIDEVYDDLALFSEHTWGADESVSRPDSTFTRSHWNAKAGFAFAAHDGARELAVEALWRLGAIGPRSGGDSLLVFNPHPDARTAVLRRDIDDVERDVVVHEVPGFGVVRIPLPATAPVSTRAGSILETERFRIVVDPARGGVVSLIDRSLGWDLVDDAAMVALGALIVESVDSDVDHPLVRGGRDHFRPETPGPSFERVTARGDGVPVVEHGQGWSAISWTMAAPTVPEVRFRVVVHEGMPGVRLTARVMKEEQLAPEGVYIAFPFALPDPTFWLETAGAVFRADTDQLPDTCRDWYSIQNAVGISDGRRSVLWTTDDAPLVQLGRIHTGEWARRLEAPFGHLYAWPMNNLYGTNFRASQGGAMTFSFGIEARTGALDADIVRRQGDLRALPLIARPSDGQAGEPFAPLLIDTTEVTAAALELDPDGRSVRVRLQASSRGAPSMTITWTGAHPLAAWSADIFGNRRGRLEGDGRTFRLSLSSNESRTIVVERAAGAEGNHDG